MWYIKGVKGIPSKEEMLDIVIEAVFDEIVKVMQELEIVKNSKERQKLRYVLRDLSLALGRLLDRKPEESDVDLWLRELEKKIPKRFIISLRSKLEYPLKPVKHTDKVVKNGD